MTDDKQNLYTLTISCPDAIGIVAKVSGFLADQDAFITESSHFGDPVSKRFFMRSVFFAGPFTPAPETFTQKFSKIAERFQMVWGLHDAGRKPRLLIMVSKFDHCLNDLLYRYRTGDLAVDIPAIVSNHPDLAPLAEWCTASRSTDDAIDAEARKLEQEASVLSRWMNWISISWCSPATCRS